MNYHFNQKTIIQLIHLLRGQPFPLKEIRTEPDKGICRIPFDRIDEPNRDSYTLIIRNTVSCSINSEPNSEEEVFKELEYHPAEKELLFITSHGKIRITVEKIDVSAIGS
ncbi:hypothetical protein ACFL5V_07015 [Fibrobacterota bacterium]